MNSTIRMTVVATLVSAFMPALSNAGNNPKTATAVRTSTPITIDGALTEPAWNLAKPITGFTQQDPNEGSPGSMPTEIRILYDDEALYIGCRMFDPDPSKIVARLARRDDEIVADDISIRIDSYHDHQTAFEFVVTAAGVKIDIVQFNDGEEEDASWDAVWDAHTSIDERGWVAEIKIPFRALRFSKADMYTWGFQVNRRIARLNELQQWVLKPKSESGSISKYGHLTGIQGIPMPSNIEIIPYVVGDGRFMPKSPGVPTGREFKANAGFDFKYRPGSGLTIDATFNPDFGQVEADPAVLNLSTFETFYPEKRPFFVEGSQIIQFTTFGGEGGPGLFYSRRIGQALEVDPRQGWYVKDQPRFATILGAAKISGKTAGGLSIGVLEAVTRKETAAFVTSSGGSYQETAAPLTNYSLIRLRQDFLENSNVGMIVTSVNRDGQLPAMTAGIDWNVRFLESMYRIDGFLAGSRTASGFSTQEDGTAGRISFSKEGGPHWRGSLETDFTAKRFNINDMGFFRRPNDHGWVAEVLYRDDVVTEHRRFWSISSRYHRRWNFDGAELNNSVGIEGEIILPSYWELQIEGEFDRGKYDDRESRGHGLYRKPGTQNLAFQVETDQRRSVVAEAEMAVGSDERVGRYYGLRGEVEIKPATNTTLYLELQREIRRREFAWVATLTGPPDGAIFAERTADEWSLTTRGSYVFSTDLTLQVYFQLFFAKGTYENYEQMVGDDRHFHPYTWWLPSRDFDDISFNSNVVLRWEYLPGSTIYLVWSQARKGALDNYHISVTDNFRNAFSLPMDNVLLLKASYWFSM